MMFPRIAIRDLSDAKLIQEALRFKLAAMHPIQIPDRTALLELLTDIQEEIDRMESDATDHDAGGCDCGAEICETRKAEND